MATITQALHKLRPNTEWVIQGNDLSTLEFIKPKNAVAPTQDEVDAVLETLDAEIAQEVATKAAARQAIADRLGLSADELQVLLG
jgi:hypothetical protein